MLQRNIAPTIKNIFDMKNLTNNQVAMNFILQCYGKSHTGNMKSTGITLYSYTTAIAAWYKNKDGKYILIVNTTRYSQTTSCKHMHPLKREIEKRGIEYYTVKGRMYETLSGLIRLYEDKYVNVG